jgi:hypothetical protein
MEHIAEQCWTRIESIRHRVRAVCGGADKDELASVDAELVELREFVFASLRARKETALIPR